MDRAEPAAVCMEIGIGKSAAGSGETQFLGLKGGSWMCHMLHHSVGGEGADNRSSFCAVLANLLSVARGN